MRFIYLTSVTFPSQAANTIQVKYMAEAFYNNLGDSFTFVICKDDSNELEIPAIKTNCTKYRKFHLVTPFYFFWLIKFLKQNRSDELTFFTKDHKLGVLLALMRKTFKFKFIFEFHHMYKERLDKFILNNSDFILTLTSAGKRQLAADYRLQDGKIIALPDGVDLKSFDTLGNELEYRKELNISIDKKIIGYTGSASTRGIGKGLEYLLEALNFLRKEVNAQLILAGVKAEEAETLKKYIRKFNLEEAVSLINHQPHEVIPKYLKSFNVLVLPYPENAHFSYFMSPLKLFEYMAAQKPIVATDLPSLREVLDERSAIFVKPSDSLSLAAGIKDALLNENKAKSISKRAYENVKNYTWDKRVESIINLLN